jgi:hypothetical protein
VSSAVLGIYCRKQTCHSPWVDLQASGGNRINTWFTDNRVIVNLFQQGDPICGGCAGGGGGGLDEDFLTVFPEYRKLGVL